MKKINTLSYCLLANAFIGSPLTVQAAADPAACAQGDDKAKTDLKHVENKVEEKKKWQAFAKLLLEDIKDLRRKTEIQSIASRCELWDDSSDYSSYSTI